MARVLAGDGSPVGTCFQVAPGVLATAWHVLDSLGAGELGGVVSVDSLSRAERGTQAVRLGVVAEGGLARLPWEALPDPRGPRPLVLHPLVSMYRRAQGASPAAVPGPLRVLVAISSPDRGRRGAVGL